MKHRDNRLTQFVFMNQGVFHLKRDRTLLPYQFLFKKNLKFFDFQKKKMIFSRSIYHVFDALVLVLSSQIRYFTLEIGCFGVSLFSKLIEYNLGEFWYVITAQSENQHI